MSAAASHPAFRGGRGRGRGFTPKPVPRQNARQPRQNQSMPNQNTRQQVARAPVKKPPVQESESESDSDGAEDDLDFVLCHY